MLDLVRNTQSESSSDLEIEEGFLHLALVGDHLPVVHSSGCTELCMKVSVTVARGTVPLHKHTLTFPCLSKLNSAKLQTYPLPSTCTENSRKKSIIAGAQAGSESHNTSGVNSTERISCPNIIIFMAKSSPNA